MAIECPQCSSHNADGALHCDQCGFALRGGGPKSRGLPILLIATSIIAIVAVSFLLLDRGSHPTDTTHRRTTEETGAPLERLEPPPATSSSGVLDAPPAELLAQDASVPSGKLVAGWLQFEDPHGVIIDRVATAATRSGWLAVPRLPALGSEKWIFRPGLGGETLVIDGIWRRGESMGLWRIESPDLAVAPLLEPWVEGESLTFISFSANRREEFDAPRNLRSAGLFLRGDAPIDLGSGGVLMQGGAIVGWGTGASEIGGEESALWLWTAEPGVDLASERTVEDFYADSFAGGREEALATAHAAVESSDSRLSVLRSYAAALLLQPRLLPDETREQWIPASAVLPVARAMRGLLDAGAPGSILEAVDLAMVRLLGDAAVFLLWIDAVGEVDGAEAALILLDQWGAELVPEGSDLEEQFVSRLLTFLRDALRLAIDRGDLGRAWAWVEDGRRRFPDDSDLYLSEVELWLGEGDWRRAEEMMEAVSFPASFRERVARLERLISELKGAEGRIVIRFRPGASSITTHTDLSGIEQLFIVDTGASYTSIPWSTVNALGIRIDANTPRRQLRTASDVISVPVVTLPEVTLGGWTVHNVEATVLDLPGNESLGLLGLNFLGEFRIDLDREQGRMTLEPK